MSRSPLTIDAALCAWALVAAHADECPATRNLMFSAGDVDLWKAVANHLSEQLGHRVHAEFGDCAGDVIGRVRSIVRDEAAGGGQRPEADR